MRRLMLACLLMLGTPLFAQQDTLKYDGMGNDVYGYDCYLIAGSMFPGELDMFYNTRFTPTERCTVNGVQIAMSVVKFVAHSGFDTLLVQVFDTDHAVPPPLVNVVKTYRYPLGDMGFPSPNVSAGDPLQQGARAVVTVPFNPPVVIAPKRDFLIGVKLQTTQSYLDTASQGTWNGLSLLMKMDSPESLRYRRYMVNLDPSLSENGLATDTRNVSIFMRALVTYDASLKDTVNVAVETPPIASGMVLEQNHPNPCAGPTAIRYSLDAASTARLTIHDALGREVALLADGFTGAGTHTVRFDPRALARPPAAGLYVIRLVAGSQVRTRTMLMVR